MVVVVTMTIMKSSMSSQIAFNLYMSLFVLEWPLYICVPFLTLSFLPLSQCSCTPTTIYS